jgi:hypothetical protein
VLPGFYCLGGTLNVTQTHLVTSPSHADLGRSHESENCRSSAEQWRCYDGEWWGANSATADDGEWWGANSAAADDGEWWSANSATADDGEWWGTNSAAADDGEWWGTNSAAAKCPINSSRI